MKRANPLRVAALTLLACAAVPASAQLKKAPSPAGAWEFETDELYDTCTISGEMEIVPSSGASSKMFTCKFRAVQACHNREIRTIHTDQSCSASQIGSQISIVSRLDKVVSVDPEWQMEGMERRYAPDNFFVSINPNGDEMDGMFESRGEAPVKFRRKVDLVS